MVALTIIVLIKVSLMKVSTLKKIRARFFFFNFRELFIYFSVLNI